MQNNRSIGEPESPLRTIPVLRTVARRIASGELEIDGMSLSVFGDVARRLAAFARAAHSRPGKSYDDLAERARKIGGTTLHPSAKSPNISV